MDNQLLCEMFDAQMEILNDLYFSERLMLPLKTKADIYLAKELHLNVANFIERT
tara:strand:- start:42 stop:203 length:162 start_codon:yes stop_codon:yes gene_type:complete